MLETTITVDSVVTATLLALLAGLIRNVAGWLENALKDGKIEAYEWKQLIGTIIAYIGTINVMAIGLDPEIATAVMIIIDILRSALKNWA